jgi:hypothetical protein
MSSLRGLHKDTFLGFSSFMIYLQNTKEILKGFYVNIQKNLRSISKRLTELEKFTFKLIVDLIICFSPKFRLPGNAGIGRLM